MSGTLPQFGSYPTLGVLGAGGMGTVYLAHHPELGCELAIKTLVAGRGATPAQRQRFQREIRSLSQLRHPGLVEILDSGEQEGVPWLAMRRVVGGTLEQRLRGTGPLAPLEAVELGVQLCAAIGAAHERGILHRDLKPDNVLCGPGGRYVVTDFGLTKDVASAESVRLSRTGALQGTPGYWAPEQASGKGQGAGFWTDVYGVGAVLYAAVTGVPPCAGEGVFELIVATLERPPAPPSTLTAVPPDLERLVLRCLEKSQDDRFASVAALGEELRELRRSWQDAAPPGSAGSSWVWPAGAALLALLVLGLGGLALALNGRSSEGPGTRSPLEQPGSSPSPAASLAAGPTNPPVDPALLAAAPEWYRDLPEEGRPPLPLPSGVSFGSEAREYRNDADESILVWVSAGSFSMGSETGPDEELPAHSVSFEEGFFLGKREVTWVQYEAYCERTKRRRPSRVVDMRRFAGRRFEAKDDHPVFNVSWDDASSYCREYGLRLPSEAEWEYAARGPKSATWPWGEDAPGGSLLNLADEGTDWDWPLDAKRDLGLMKAEFRDGFAYTAPVGLYRAGASPFGCLDMAGNVEEWVQDSYSPNYAWTPRDGRPFESADSTPAPRGGPLGVGRGGCWNVGSQSCRGASRQSRPQRVQLPVLGFRVARSIR